MPDEIVRCPYCVQGEDFRQMLSRPLGWFLCPKCGHTVKPGDLQFKCSCRKCAEMNWAA
jgi:hypothetical protein